MVAASIKQLQPQLDDLTNTELAAICIRMAKYKKENKELLTYLLFEASNEAEYVKHITTVVDDLFETINLQQLYFAKKSLRKIIRVANKYINFSEDANTAIVIWMHVYKKIMDTGIDFKQSKVIDNMRVSVEKKINKQIGLLHEDLQYDYRKMWTSLLK